MMKYLDLLGHEVTDCVTGFRGVAEAVSYDLYGCIQVLLRSPMIEKGKLEDARWFDGKRLSKTTEQPVMPAPSFEQEDGPAEKPAAR
jgi:hypothetical protein